MAKHLDRVQAVATILLPCGIAAAIVARTLAVYWGRDSLASAVVVAIACALAVGVRELFVRQARNAQLERELRALPRTLDASTLDKAGPQLSALLRARLEQQPLPPANDGMAPFLTGLLVMLGLLGTLLGLFQTLQGAGHALTSSADLDALRRGLQAPIAGLTRSFGCAAAGISASAMLGLASALLRRRETAALRAVAAYALGPLRELSASARQLRAIEQLAQQGGALPAAATAIERVGTQLAEMSGTLVTLQRTALEAQQRALRELVTDVRRELGQSASDTGAALHAQLAPLFERDTERRRTEAADALHALRVRLDEAEAARAAAHANELATVTSLHVRALAEVERREKALGDRWQELADRHAQQHAELERLSGALGSELEQRIANERRQTERVEQAFQQLAAAGAAVEQSSARQEGMLEQLVERVAPLFEQTAESSRETAQLALERIEQSARLLEDTIARQGGAIETLVERVTAVLPELAAAAQAGAVTTLERLGALGEEQAARLSQLEAARTRERDEHARGLAEQLESHAAGIEQRLGRTSGAVEEAAAIWRASTVEMQAVAQLFATSVERQREAAEAWLESLGAIEHAVESSGREAASDALSEQLASTQELFARQLQFQRELLTQLRTLRGAPGKLRSASGGQDVPAGE